MENESALGSNSRAGHDGYVKRGAASLFRGQREEDEPRTTHFGPEISLHAALERHPTKWCFRRVGAALSSSSLYKVPTDLQLETSDRDRPGCSRIEVPQDIIGKPLETDVGDSI